MGRKPVEVKTVLNVVVDIIHHCVRRNSLINLPYMIGLADYTSYISSGIK